VTSEESENGAVDYAPCADSNLTLKGQIEKLDYMELVDNNKSTCDKTDNDKSIK
jgi:hypothetical protein